jgi:hypothetical protein
MEPDKMKRKTNMQGTKSQSIREFLKRTAISATELTAGFGVIALLSQCHNPEYDKRVKLLSTDGRS